MMRMRIHHYTTQRNTRAATAVLLHHHSSFFLFLVYPTLMIAQKRQFLLSKRSQRKRLIASIDWPKVIQVLGDSFKPRSVVPILASVRMPLVCPPTRFSLFVASLRRPFCFYKVGACWTRATRPTGLYDLTGPFVGITGMNRVATRLSCVMWDPPKTKITFTHTFFIKQELEFEVTHTLTWSLLLVDLIKNLICSVLVAHCNKDVGRVSN